MIADIVAAIRPLPGERVVEIGPGLGALSRPLLAALGRLDAIEIDRDLAATLQEQFGSKLSLHQGDVLDFDFHILGSDLRIVGNLPYNISTPLLFHLAKFAPDIRDIHVMVQDRFSVELLIEVPPTAFNPAPKVDSAVVRLTPLQPLPHLACDEKVFAQVVAMAFSQRRKTLRNSLSACLSSDDLARIGIAPTARAQELTVAQFVAIADYVAQAGRTAATSCPSE